MALTSHLIMTFEQLLLHHLRPHVRHALHLMQFADQEKVEVEDAILHRLHSHTLTWTKGAVLQKSCFVSFYLSRAFNTI